MLSSNALREIEANRDYQLTIFVTWPQSWLLQLSLRAVEGMADVG